jgi:hypothetical protein
MKLHHVIRIRKGPLGTAYTCPICGFAEVKRASDQTSRPWGRIVEHLYAHEAHEKAEAILSHQSKRPS